MKKQEQIAAKKIKPIEIGDFVGVEVPYETTTDVTEGKGKNKVTKSVTSLCLFSQGGDVVDIVTLPKFGLVYVVAFSSTRIPTEVLLVKSSDYVGHRWHVYFKAEHVSPTYLECGANPFKKEAFRVDFYNQDISSMLFKACYGKHDDNFKTPKYDVVQDNGNNNKAWIGKTHGGVNFNPTITDNDGKIIRYQRDLVWTLEQKQLLIDSIYNGIEIGKFLFRKREWSLIDKDMTNNTHAYHMDCVDGKQRYDAILSFVQNKFADSHGNFWEDLSPDAQRKFLGYSKLTYGEMGDTAKDSDIIDTFLTMNFTGTPMSKEHIEFVQSIKM